MVISKIPKPTISSALAFLAIISLASNLSAFEVNRTLDTFEKILDPLVDKNQIPGYYFSISKDGNMVYERSKGYADIASRLIPQEDTLFSIQGFTTLFTALTILKLADEGVIEISDPVEKYIPEFSEMTVAPNGMYDRDQEIPKTEVTLQHLLTHTSGLTRATNVRGGVANDVAESFRQNEIMTMTSMIESAWGGLKGQVSALSEMPLTSHPGESFQFSVGYDVLGRVIEIATRKPLSKAMEKLLFEPLSLKDTTFLVEPDDWWRLARMYSTKILSANLQQRTTTFKPATVLLKNMKNFGMSTEGYVSGAAGLISSARDFRLIQDLILRKGRLNGEVFISEEKMKLLLVHQLPKSLGDAPLRTSLGPIGKNSGATAGLLVRWESEDGMYDPQKYDFYFGGGLANTVFWIDPNTGISGLFLTQILPFRFPPFERLENLAEKRFGGT